MPQRLMLCFMGKFTEYWSPVHLVLLFVVESSWLNFAAHQTIKGFLSAEEGFHH